MPVKNKTRNRFHTDFKIAVSANLISNKQLSFLPKSTKYALKNISPEQFADLVGLDYSRFDLSNPDLISEVEVVKSFAQSKNAKILYRAGLYIKNTIISIILGHGSLNFKQLKIKQKAINCINRVKDVIGFDRTLRYFNIARSTFYNWSKQLYLKCTDSPIGKCLNIWPTQITIKEIDAIKNIVIEKLKLFWPLTVIWGYAFSNNFISCSYSTFIKYVKILQLNKNIHSFKKTRKQGLISSAPNQFWNADVSIYKLLDGTKAYIYFVIDNFSNFILAWLTSSTLSSKLRKQTVEDAYLKYGNHNPNIIYNDVFPLLNADLTIENYYIHLMTDGGPENHGELDAYLNKPDVKIRKLIALKDIDYSNSAIEALNKTVKYQQLHLINIPDIQTLNNTLDKWVPVYNNERTNRKGGYLLTPSDLYNGKTIDKTQITDRLKQARADRIAFNKQHSCGVC